MPGPGSDEPLGELRGVGLTEYQARAYLALLRLGKATAAQLARAAGVPRNKLYPVMRELNLLGVVETSLGEAQVYRPLPLDRFLDERAAALAGEARDLEARRALLLDRFRPQEGAAPAPAATYRVFHGRANAVEQVRIAARGARRSLALLAPGLAPARMLASGEAEALRERLDEGLEVRVVAGPAAGPGGEGEALAGLLGPALRVARVPLPGLVLLSADRELALQVQVEPDDAHPAQGHDVCLVAASPALAASAAHHVGLLWDASTAPARGRAAGEPRPAGLAGPEP